MANSSSCRKSTTCRISLAVNLLLRASFLLPSFPPPPLLASSSLANNCLHQYILRSIRFSLAYRYLFEIQCRLWAATPFGLSRNYPQNISSSRGWPARKRFIKYLMPTRVILCSFITNDGKCTRLVICNWYPDITFPFPLRIIYISLFSFSFYKFIALIYCIYLDMDTYCIC